MSNQNNDMFKSKVLGHPSGLFVLFFTEMWERFSYYGMRSLLVLFLTASILDGGWGWDGANASVLFGTYVSLVYLSTLMGGYFADRVMGYRRAVVVGALLMTGGHAFMAIETEWSIYLGLILLVFGNGFFKPNMTSIISHMYKDYPEKKDGAYTIFYMGVNAGAFLGILLCGYLGEKVGWGIGFGLAGIFMLFGMLQFWFTQNIFGDIGLKPVKEVKSAEDTQELIDSENATDEEIAANPEAEPRNPFPTWQMVMIAIMSTIGLVWVVNDPMSKIYGVNMLNFEIGGVSGSLITILTGLAMFLFVLVYRLLKYTKVTMQKMIAVSFFAFLTIFFWAIFEQSPNTLTTFARDYTDRSLEGSSVLIFNIINSLITIIPLGIITWVLIKLFGQTFAKYKLGNLILALGF